MPSRFHKLRARQLEREPLTAHGRINLVPLVDILTSIVFFSLLTYTGAVMTNLTAFDLALPPVVVTAPGQTSGAQPDTVTLILAVGIKPELRETSDVEMPPDYPPAAIGLLPNDEYIVTEGGLTGQRGYFTRTATGTITALDLAGRLFTRTT